MKPETTKPADQTDKARKPESKIEGSKELNDVDLDKVTGSAIDSYMYFQNYTKPEETK
jgi:hypothetical protein